MDREPRLLDVVDPLDGRAGPLRGVDVDRALVRAGRLLDAQVHPLGDAGRRLDLEEEKDAQDHDNDAGDKPKGPPEHEGGNESRDEAHHDQVGGGEIDESAFSQQKQFLAALQRVLFHEWSDSFLLFGNALQRRDIDLNVKMAAIGHDSAVFH